jgi:hypothetical protein
MWAHIKIHIAMSYLRESIVSISQFTEATNITPVPLLNM